MKRLNTELQKHRPLRGTRKERNLRKSGQRYVWPKKEKSKAAESFKKCLSLQSLTKGGLRNAIEEALGGDLCLGCFRGVGGGVSTQGGRGGRGRGWLWTGKERKDSS